MKDETQNLITGILIGTVAGLAIGLLFAPEKGQDARRIISDKASNLGKDVSDKLDKTFSKITEFADSALASFSKETRETSTTGTNTNTGNKI